MRLDLYNININFGFSLVSVFCRTVRTARFNEARTRAHVWDRACHLKPSPQTHRHPPPLPPHCSIRQLLLLHETPHKVMWGKRTEWGICPNDRRLAYFRHSLQILRPNLTTHSLSLSGMRWCEPRDINQHINAAYIFTSHRRTTPTDAVATVAKTQNIIQQQQQQQKNTLPAPIHTNRTRLPTRFAHDFDARARLKW